MQPILLDDPWPRPRDPAQERRERQRYALLLRIFDRTTAAGDVPISALEVGQALRLSREDTFRLVQFLAHHGYLDYVGAGPRVRLTEKGIAFLTTGAGRRRSLRDP